MLDLAPPPGPAVRTLAPLRPGWAAAWMAIADILAVELAIALSLGVRWAFGGFFQKAALFDSDLPILAGVAIVVLNGALGLYPGYGLSAPERFRRRLVGAILVFSLMVAYDYLLQYGMWSRVVTLLSCAMAVILLPMFNNIVRELLQKRGRWGVPVAVHGMGESADDVIRHLRRRPDLGFIPVVCLSDDAAEWGRHVAGLPVIGPAGGAVERLPGIRHVFVYLPHLPPDQWTAVINRLQFPHVFLVPSMTGHRSLWVRTTDLQGTLALSMADNLLDRRKLAIKQVMDFCLTVPLVLAFLPLLLCLYLAVRLTSRGPAIFTQPRVGRNGRVYDIYKLRTMVVDAERILADYLDRTPDAAVEYRIYRKLRRDPRVTPVGRFLRRYSLDELPQLINVLKGDMSLVGPRCYMPHEVPDMGGHHELIHCVKPGVTGYWQVSGRNRTTFDERVEMDVYYIRNWSVSFDLYILYETTRVVLTGRDAC